MEPVVWALWSRHGYDEWFAGTPVPGKGAGSVDVGGGDGLICLSYGGRGFFSPSEILRLSLRVLVSTFLRAFSGRVSTSS